MPQDEEQRHRREVQALIAEADRRPLSGWDVDYDGRIATQPPWDFAAMVDARARSSPDLLDLGTGGGEWLSRLPHRPARTIATEGWAPSLPAARARLRPIGVSLIAVDGAPDNTDQDGSDRVDSDRDTAHHVKTRADAMSHGAADADDGRSPDRGALPFADGSFHLVMSRHESYVPRDIARILAPAGRLLTQQVATGVEASADLHRLLHLPIPPATGPAWTLDVAARQLTDAGLVVDDAREGDEWITFADVGALVWYVTRLPWVLPGFSIAASRDRLQHLHEAGEGGTAIAIRQPLFVLTARKPA